MAKKEYQGHEYEVKREKSENNSTQYEYEFNLYIDEEIITTATRLESKGVAFNDIPNWTKALEAYAKEYIETGLRNKAVRHVLNKYPE